MRRRKCTKGALAASQNRCIYQVGSTTESKQPAQVYSHSYYTRDIIPSCLKYQRTISHKDTRNNHPNLLKLGVTKVQEHITDTLLGTHHWLEHNTTAVVWVLLAGVEVHLPHDLGEHLQEEGAVRAQGGGKLGGG